MQQLPSLDEQFRAFLAGASLKLAGLTGDSQEFDGLLELAAEVDATPGDEKRDTAAESSAAAVVPASAPRRAAVIRPRFRLRQLSRFVLHHRWYRRRRILAASRRIRRTDHGKAR
mmetsp:Transcript_56566/g.93796  ORF Transcript_56566/g.93796 Transcript_56566/m.93796 type:complete len:115 (+) Transcript_56566:60-404(+)